MNQVKARLTFNRAPQAVVQAAEVLMHEQRDENIQALWQRFKGNPKIKWKDSIKKIVGIEAPQASGLDV